MTDKTNKKIDQIAYSLLLGKEKKKSAGPRRQLNKLKIE